LLKDRKLIKKLYICTTKKEKIMTAFFKGIKYFFEEIAFAPYDYLRHLELSSWWGANIATWIMIVVLFGFFFYWVKQLIKFSKEGTERVDVTAHSFFK
jgi:hypothetical protein